MTVCIDVQMTINQTVSTESVLWFSSYTEESKADMVTQNVQ